MGKVFQIDETLLQESLVVLDKIGVDVDTVIRMTLKRIVRDGGISFLVMDVPHQSTVPLTQPREQEQGSVPGRMTKAIAVARLREQGIEVKDNVTFASKNRASNNYWANPSFDVLNRDWYLILNNWKKNELHLFKIPANSIPAWSLVSRNDKPDKIDLQIGKEDPSFTDLRSKISFLKFRVTSIRY